MPLDAISGAMLIIGALVMLAGATGVIRFPDFYSRMHAAGMGDTLGQFLVVAGLAIPAGLSLVSLKLAIIVFFIFVCNPTATHALARSAWRLGLKPVSEDGGYGVEQYEGQLTSAEEREALFLPVQQAPDSVLEEDDEDGGEA